MVVNVTRLRMFHVQTTQNVRFFLFFFKLLKGSDPSCIVLKFGDILSRRNWDMAQHVILQGCSLKRSRLSIKVKEFSIRPPSISNHVKFHQNLIASFIITAEQSLTERWPGEKRRENIGETIWQTLTLCNTKFTMKERPDVKVTSNNLKIFLWTFIWHVRSQYIELLWR